MGSDLFSSLFEVEDVRPLSVSELNAQVCSALERQFASVWVEGEIVNFSAARSGHWYFTLHDGRSQLKAACYRGSNSRIRFQPFDGLQVRVRGRLTLYEPRGEYQILIESLEPVGEGALKVAFEQIKARLASEGIFAEELKRPLPAFPRRIGIVTSPTGAAFFDILHVLSRRVRSVSLVLVPTRVQGETAGEEICSAIRSANEFSRSGNRIDVLIVGRGGGSAEDLWAFNEEPVARAIRDSAIPVISAVGHEIDFTIADLAADMRAPTPSAAAEIVAQREDDILSYLDRREADLFQAASYRLLEERSRFQALELSPVFVEFPAELQMYGYRVDELSTRLRATALERTERLEGRLAAVLSNLSPARLTSRVGGCRTKFELLAQRHSNAISEVLAAKSKSLHLCSATLDALSPLAVMDRGFSIVQTEKDRIIRDARDVSAGDKLKIRLANGKLSAEVLSSEEAG